MSDDLIYEMTMTKQGLADALGVDSSILHIPVGLLFFGLFCALFRVFPRCGLWSALAVIVVQLINEYVDALQWLRWTGSVNWREAVVDTVLTMVLPGLLVVVDQFQGRNALRAEF